MESENLCNYELLSQCRQCLLDENLSSFCQHHCALWAKTLRHLVPFLIGERFLRFLLGGLRHVVAGQMKMSGLEIVEEVILSHLQFLPHLHVQ